MDFQTKRIRPDNHKLPVRKNISLRTRLPLILSLVIIVILIFGIGKAISSINFNPFLTLAGDELKKDAFGHTNILVLGIGGGTHEGADLTDTIMVASLDSENKLATILSLPRDYYVKDTTVGSGKINGIYYYAKKYFGSSTEGIDYMKSKVEGILGIPVHYWIKIDFEGFKDLVDALGGIDVYVKQAIYDPEYPKDGTIYFEPFSISAGQQHLDGATALKYARSRHTTSDFDRADRQQQIIYAIKEKGLQTEILLDPTKIENVLKALQDNIETNIKVKEILTLGAQAKNFGEGNLIHRLIHDDPTQCGGFLYPPAREVYNMYALLPAGGEKLLHYYTDLSFNYPLISHANTKIHVLNGTPRAGAAGETKQILQRFCFEINRFGNGSNKSVTTTTYYYKQQYDEKGKPIDSRPIAIDFLKKIIPGVESTNIPADYTEYMTSTDIILELGQDYTSSDNYLEDPYYYLPPAPTPTTPTTTETTTTPAAAATPTAPNANQ